MQVAPKGSAYDGDSYGNSEDVEATWAMQAMDHAECHMSLLLSGVRARACVCVRACICVHAFVCMRAFV